MGMLEIPGTLRAGSIEMDADATGGGDSIGNSLSQKFSFVDSVPATDGVAGGATYTYTITGTGHSFYYAKMTLSGKDGAGTHRTAEIEVFNGELQSLFLSNIDAREISVALYGNTVVVSPLFFGTWFFTNHVEGYTGTLGGGYGKHMGDRGIASGGATNPPVVDTIEYYNIAITSNAADFGELVNGTNYYHSSYGNGSRVLFTGGFSPGTVDDVEYITVATKGNSIDFGELTQSRSAHRAGDSDGSRGVDPGGTNADPALVDTIDYLTVGTLGDSTDFGELTAITQRHCGAGGSGRLCIQGGQAGPTVAVTDTMTYITIGTIGNAIDFGEMVEARAYIGATSDENRIVTFMGSDATGQLDTVEFVSIGTLGDATDWGEMVGSGSSRMGASNGYRGTTAGGWTVTDDIFAITIGTLGSATDWGSLTQARYQPSNASGD